MQIPFASLSKKIFIFLHFSRHTQAMKTIILKRIFHYFISCSVLVACATPSRPHLYPNEVYNTRGPQNAQMDIDQCLKDAETYFDTPEGKKVARGGDTTSAVGVGFGFGTGGMGMGAGVGSGTVISGKCQTTIINTHQRQLELPINMSPISI